MAMINLIKYTLNLACMHHDVLFGVFLGVCAEIWHDMMRIMCIVGGLVVAVRIWLLCHVYVISG